MNVIGQIAAVTFGGIIPGSSHFFAVSVAARAKGEIDLINNRYKNALGGAEDIRKISFRATVVRNLITISLVRDVLAIAAVVTLACLSILTPAVAIGIGAALLVSIVLSSVAIGQTVSVIKAADLSLAPSVF